MFNEEGDGLRERAGTDAESAFDDASFTADVFLNGEIFLLDKRAAHTGRTRARPLQHD